MCKLILVVLAIVSTVPSSFAAEDTYWRAFNFSKSTPDSVIMMFGPPSTIKTEELYSDWVKTQATGCGQVHTYAMSYSIASGDLNILKGPLGKASNVSVVIEEGKLSQIIWTYDNNQLQPALLEWISNKGFDTTVTKKPGVVMMGIWKPKKGTIVTADCYTGGEGAICRGPILVYYTQD
jgi:hypothetical protein